MKQETTFPQLSFAINNKEQANTIYITTDPANNQLTFTITTNIENTHLNIGQLVPPADASSSTGTELYLDLSSLQIPAADFAKIVCTATGWLFQSYPDSIICMAPTADTVIGVTDTVTIEIANLILPNPPETPNVNIPVTYYRASPITIGNLPQVSFFKVLLQAAPDGSEDLHEAVDCALTTTPFIVNTIDNYGQVQNNITLAFKPGTKPTTVKAGSSTTFTVSFVYAPNAPGYGALTTPQSACDNIVVEQGENASAWSVTPNTNAANPCWVLQPPKDAPIIGTGTGAIVSFYVNDIVTRFEPGSTLMYVQYQNVPGYNDGAYYITLTKVPHVSISSINVNPNPSVINNGEASVDITWAAKDYTSLMLMPFYQDVTSVNSFKAKLKKSTLINLVATGAGNSANQATATITADVLPVINSFDVTPTDVYYHDYPHDAKFYWEVDTNDTVLLVNDTTGASENVPKNSSKTINVTAPGMWSLIPQDTANPYTLARNVLVQSFKLDPQPKATTITPTTAVASPSAEFISVLDKTGNTINILNALNFSQYVPPITAGGSPVDEVFSYNGVYLFVLNATGSVTVIKVTWDASKGLYSFNTLTTLTIEGTPVRIAISNDDKYIFVTTALTGLGKLVVIENTGVDQFTIKQSIELTQSPAGIAVDPSGLNVYVAMSGDNSIAVIGYSSVNNAFTYNRSITNIPQNPIDIAVGDPQGKTLMVVCTAANQLMVLDYDDDGTSPRQSIEIKTGPVRIATTPDRAYAIVINNTSNDGVLVSCYGGTGSCKVLEAGLKTGNKPNALSMANDGTAAYITNGDKAVVTLNVMNYQVRNTPIDIGKQPTSVIASNDGKKVVMWHNALYISAKPGFTKGIYIYETSSGSVSTRLEEDTIVKCVFSSTDPTALMYLIKQNIAEVTVMETLRFTVKSAIQIPKGAGSVQRFPVELGMSANAKNLYVLTRDASGKYSFLAFTADETKGTYTLNTDVDVFTNSSTSNNVLMQNTPDGTNVFVLSSLDKTIWNLKLSVDKYVLNTKTVSLSILARTMVTAPDNSTLYVILQQTMSSAMVTVNVADLTSWEHKFPASYSTLINFQQAVVSPDGSMLFITDANIAGVRIMSAATLRVIQTLSWSSIEYPVGIAIQRNGSAVYITGFNSNNMTMINQIIN
ncbi:hypothetical protein A0256_19655 [Mucilaginibacter sp. PAMC 26640]|nr:hypothetical protein A0256_19655 [Mucilaginibacter sp. PAMC 26640]